MAVTEADISNKILRYETFLNENLREDLKTLERRIKEINDSLTSWLLLKKSLNDIHENHCKGFKTKQDIGCGFLMQVNVKDPSVVKMFVGLNVYLDMTLDDGLKYCDFRIGLLNKELTHVQHQANNVKVHIKLVLLGLNELQRI